MLSFLYPVSRMVRGLVLEKETRIKEGECCVQGRSVVLCGVVNCFIVSCVLFVCYVLRCVFQNDVLEIWRMRHVENLIVV